MTTTITLVSPSGRFKNGSVQAAITVNKIHATPGTRIVFSVRDELRDEVTDLLKKASVIYVHDTPRLIEGFQSYAPGDDAGNPFYSVVLSDGTNAMEMNLVVFVLKHAALTEGVEYQIAD